MRGFATKIAVFAAIAVLFGLGTWQVKRMFWKEGLIRSIEERRAAPAIGIEGFVSPEESEFRMMRLSGRFLHADEIHLFRQYKGEPGFFVLTPLLAADGRKTLVNRGWVPKDKKDQSTRAAFQPRGNVTITGMVRLTEKKRPFVPENGESANMWFYIDLPAIAAGTGVDGRFFVQQTDSGQPLPVSMPARIELLNDHLEYAATWYALALGLGVVAWVRHKSI